MTSLRGWFFTGLSSVILLNSIPKPLFAQSLLGSVWPTEGFAVLEWLRAEDQKVLYRSEVFLATNRNQVSIYNTFKQDPFGSLARCGGLGCDLARGDLVATLTIEPGGNGIFFVQAATGSAEFMQEARCQVETVALPVLTCYSQQGPNSTTLPSIIRVSPGT